MQRFLIPGLVFDQEEEVVMRRLAVPGFAVEAAARGDVRLAAEDGLDALVLGDFLKLDRAEDVAVVGQGHGRHVVARRRPGPGRRRRTAPSRMLYSEWLWRWTKPGAMALFPFDRARRLAGDVEDDAVDPGHFVDDPGGNPGQEGRRGAGNQSAVMPSTLWTSRMTTTLW